MGGPIFYKQKKLLKDCKMRQKYSFQQNTVCSEHKFTPKKYIFYTDNIHASVKNWMSGRRIDLSTKYSWLPLLFKAQNVRYQDMSAIREKYLWDAPLKFKAVSLFIIFY